MRLLIDECLPRALKLHFRGHECRTVQEMGWSGRKNGALIEAAEREFDVLVTIDQGIQHQQNLANRKLGVLILDARSNQIEDLLPILPLARSALRSLRPGTARLVGG